jgi:sulfonate transport system substrate-binding protein
MATEPRAHRSAGGRRPSSSPSPTRRTVLAGLLAAPLSLGATGCLIQGEGRGSVDGITTSEGTVNIDYATYNPLSLVIRHHGWLEQELGEQGVGVNWVFSAGSNKANELLRAEAVDLGSTAGVAALLNRSNGAPTQVVAVANRPEWAGLLVPADSPAQSLEDLRGGSVAATRGTDPFFFTVRALQGAGIDLSEVEVQNLQHADGRQAMEAGSVTAWAGLDPIMGGALGEGARFLHRDLDLNTFSVVQATESFIQEHPERLQTVMDTYQRARVWALENPEETARILAEAAGIEPEVARSVITERTNVDVSPVPGEDLHATLAATGRLLVQTGDVDYQEQVDAALDTLFAPRFAEEATR